MGRVFFDRLSLMREVYVSGGGSVGGRILMDSWGTMVVRVIRNNLRWGLGTGMSMGLSSQLGEELLYMRVRRGCVTSAYVVICAGRDIGIEISAGICGAMVVGGRWRIWSWVKSKRGVGNYGLACQHPEIINLFF